MPFLKRDLLEQFCERSVTTVQAFAKRCRVSRESVRKANEGKWVTNKVAVATAIGMGFLPEETCLLCKDDKTHSIDDLIKLSLQRLGLGLWGVCDHSSHRSDRLTAILGQWRGTIRQHPIPNGNGGSMQIESKLEGQLHAAGRTVGGEFTQVVTTPDNSTVNIKLRVEGYWFDDMRYIAIYRYAEPGPHNYGTVHLELSIFHNRFEGTFTGWGSLVKDWISGTVCLERV
jgi:hypothetical protein